MLIFHQIYKKFLIQYVLFSLNLYRNLQTPHKNTTSITALIKALIDDLIESLIEMSINGPIKGSV